MTEGERGRFSLWRDPQALDETRARALADRALELRGRAEDAAAVIRMPRRD